MTPVVPARLSDVAGAAPLDELRLAGDEVVAVVLELAARRADQQPHAHDQRREPLARSPHAADPNGWRGAMSTVPDAPGLRARELVELAARGGDHGARDAVPRLALAGDLDDRLAGRRRARRPARVSQPTRRGGELAHRAPARPRRTATAAPLGRRRRRSASATSASPECRATTGSAPQAAASAATIPNASGNVLGTTSASAAGRRSTSSAWSRRPAHATRSPSPRAAAR